MGDQIVDGKGRGFRAAVNSDRQLVTRATVVEQRLASSLDSNYFEATTGKITLTNDSDTAMIFLQNSNNGKSMVIDRIFYDFFTSTNGTGVDGTLTYYINPTANTSATVITPTNTDFGSSVSAVGTFYGGTTAIDAFTSGSVWWTAYITDQQSITVEEGRIVLPNGSSFGIKVDPPTGNTSMAVNINIAFYYFNPKLIG